MQKIKRVFKGKLLEVFVEKKRLPNGYLATFEEIRHPGAALIVPFLGKDKIIMLKQLRPVIRSYIYELPAGTLEKRELPIDCARREIIEETGFAARTLKLLGSIYPVPGYSTERIFIYKAEGLKKVERPACPKALLQAGRRVEEDEVIRSIVMDRRKVRRLFRSGKIVDAKTIAALAFCGWT